MIVDKISFAGGEITPLLRAAYDLDKSQTGLARIENFVGVAQRGITRRPGTRFAEALVDQSKKGLLIPFKAGNDDQAVLVINAGTMRVARLTGYLLAGGAPYTLAGLPYGEADLPSIRYAQSVDVVFLGCKGLSPRQIVRKGPTDWSLANYEQSYGPYRLQNIDKAWTLACSAQGAAARPSRSRRPRPPSRLGTSDRSGASTNRPSTACRLGWRLRKTCRQAHSAASVAMSMSASTGR